MNQSLNYEGLMLLAQQIAMKHSDRMYPPWRRKEREREFERLTLKYYREYTQRDYPVR